MVAAVLLDGTRFRRRLSRVKPQGMAATESWRTEFESAHSRLQHAIVLLENALPHDGDLRPVADGVSEALAHVYDAFDGRAVLTEAAALAQAALKMAGHSLPAEADDGLAALSGYFHDASEALARAEVELRGKPLPHQGRARDAARGVLASQDTPRLHRQERASMRPLIRVPPHEPPSTVETFEPPTARTFEELETLGERIHESIQQHVEQIADKEKEAAETDSPAPPTFTQRWARECFEEVAMLGNQRAPLLGDDWRTTRELEDRMLWAIDAFASLGSNALILLETLALDAPVPDPTRMFAATMIGGCFEGRDALGIVERLARASVSTPECLAEVSNALKLTPHQHIETMLLNWLSDSRPDFRAIATEVLVKRGALDEAQLVAATEDRPEIAKHALMSLAVAGQESFDQIVDAALTDSRLRETALTALAVRNKRRAAAELRKDGAAALPLLASMGGEDDAEYIGKCALSAPTAASLDAAAIAGHLGAVPGLIGLLRHDDQDIALAAAQALDRITGAGLYAEVEIDPVKLAEPVLPTPDAPGFAAPDKPLRDEVSDPRHRPSEGSPDTLELPAPDHQRWHDWWTDNQQRFDSGKRYRRGALHSAQVVLEELDGPLLSFEQRKRTAIELVLLTKHDDRLDPSDFVATQELAIGRWRVTLERENTGPGRWP